MRHVLTIAILLLAVGGAAWVVFGGLTSTTPPVGFESSSETEALGGESASLVVYYFDMGKDCTTCLNLEHYTLETLETHFAAQLESGTMRWARVDVDAPENKHFVERYGLYTKSVVLVMRQNGEDVGFENLSRIWELVYDKNAYMQYIRDQVSAALVEAP